MAIYINNAIVSYFKFFCRFLWILPCDVKSWKILTLIKLKVLQKEIDNITLHK